MKLSKNFTLKEFTRSRMARKNGIDNRPSSEAIENIKRLTVNLLQPLRGKIGVPIFITSGFRSKLLNALVGGVYNSQHTKGEAADIVAVNRTVKELFRFIYENFDYDQLIYEFGEWVHVSYVGDLNRHRAYVAKRLGGKVVYEKFSGNFEELE